MNNNIIYGEPIAEIKDNLKEGSPKYVIVFIIDGCRADTLYNAIDDGHMPKLKNLMENTGFSKCENCFTIFPSVTIPCHTSIVTGTYPGFHGIVGNEWFIRKKWGSKPNINDRDELFKVTREYVKYSWRHPFSDPGLANGLLTGDFFGIANSDMYQVKTIYEAYNKFIEQHHENKRSISILEMITRGADESKFIDLDDISGMGGHILGLINWVRSKITKKRYLTFPNNGLDCRAFDELLDELDEKEKKRPELYVVWLPGMDGFSHKNSASSQPEYFKDKSKLIEFFVGSIDEQFGKLHHRLRKENILDDTIITITADHGQYDCSDKLAISNEMLYHYLMYDPDVSNGEKFPITPFGKIDKECKDASVMIIGNGGACYIYVESDEYGWSKPPSQQRLEKFLPSLEKFMGTDKIFVRNPDNEYQLWENGNYFDINSLDSFEYPFAKERVNNLIQTERSGDIILSTKKPFYYAEEGMRGEHGSLLREDSHVPLLFINSNLDNDNNITRNVRTIDIAPTIAESFGFLDHLKVTGTKKDKLDAILDTLEKHIRSHFYKQGLKRTLDKIDTFGEENRVKRGWHNYEYDMRENFEFKLSNFLENEVITQEDHNNLNDKYKQIIKSSKIGIQPFSSL